VEHSPGPDDDDDDDAMASSPSAPVLEEARNCGSSQTQELLHDGTAGLPVPAMWLVTRQLRVRVRVRSKVPAGYPVRILTPRTPAFHPHTPTLSSSFGVCESPTGR